MHIVVVHSTTEMKMLLGRVQGPAPTAAVNVLQCSDRLLTDNMLLLSITLPVSSNLLTEPSNPEMLDLFLYSNFTRNSC